jgi:hypothetical protein
MLYQPEPINIVIVGAWNYAIFNPQWVSKYLFDGNEINAEVAVNTGYSYKISYKDIIFFVIENKLIITAKKPNDEVLTEMETLAYKIADFLPHTPVQAFGFNLKIKSEEVPDFKNWFSNLNDEPFKKRDYNIQAEEKKILFRKNDYDLTFGLTKRIDGYFFDINYNFLINTLSDLKEKLIPNSLKDFRQEIEDIISEEFNTQLE